MKMLPWNRPLSNLDIDSIISQTPLESIFRGTFSRDELLEIRPNPIIEAGILNLSRSDERGTHWTAWYKSSENDIFYYDSFGDLLPPPEFLKYASKCDVYFNVERSQNFNSVICGQLCICFLLIKNICLK